MPNVIPTLVTPISRQYVGARYVPIFDGAWDNTKDYAPLTVVSYEGNSYTSRTYVPSGTAINNETYWALTGNYNAQVEAYRNEVLNLDEYIHDSFCNADDYSGTNDAQILENAIADAVSNDIYNIVISRKFDITGYTVNVNLPENTPNRRKVRLIGEKSGEIYKGDSGFMFDSPDVLSHGLSLENLRISGKYSNDFDDRPDVFNCRKIIRINSFNNYITFVRDYFRNDNSAATMQSVRSLFDTFVFSRSLVRAEDGNITDVHINNDVIETNNNAIYCTEAVILGLFLEGNVIEDDNGYAVYIGTGCQCPKLAIDKCYFEANTAGHIYLHPNNVWGVSLIDNEFLHNDMSAHSIDILGSTYGIARLNLVGNYFNTPANGYYLFYIDGTIRNSHSLQLINCDYPNDSVLCNRTDYIYDEGEYLREFALDDTILQKAGVSVQLTQPEGILGYYLNNKFYIPVYFPFIAKNSNYSIVFNNVSIGGIGDKSSTAEIKNKKKSGFLIEIPDMTGVDYTLTRMDQVIYTITFA